MELEKYIKNDIILVIPNAIKGKIIKYLNNLKDIYNIKIMTFKEMETHLFFDYDEKTLIYLINKGYNFNNAKEVVKNMKYLLKNNYQKEKLNNLANLKKELDDNKLLIKDNYFNYDREILIYGFNYFSKWEKKIIEFLKEKTQINIINDERYYFEHEILEFNTLNEEIDYICNDIISKNLDLNHVFITNINKDYYETVERIFNNYNVSINLKNNQTLYDTYWCLQYLNDFNIEKIKDINIKNEIIKILNKYYFIENKKEIKNILEEEFKNTMIKKIVKSNSVNEVDLIDNYFNDNDYVYLVSFNNEYIPKIYKDTDYINDLEKESYLDNTIDKNLLEKKKLIDVIKRTKNILITYSKQNLNGGLKPSSLIEDLNYNITHKDYKYSLYSNLNNKYNLGLLLDDYLKYGNKDDNLDLLLYTYSPFNYLKYDNTYHKIDLKLSNLNLSYTKINAYYECPFKYYCNYILKLEPYEQTFDEYAGSLCHYILSKMYKKDFDFDIAKENYIKENPFDFTLENKIFINKMLNELKNVVSFLNEHYRLTKYQNVECEKSIELNIKNAKFVGIVDKIMKYNDNIAVIDYKTGATDIDLRLLPYGLKLQLPVYIYLIKEILPQSKITGIYLEHIISPIINYNPNREYLDQINDNLKLQGYSTNNENILNDFDPTYQKSEFIKGMSLTANGFSKYAKILSEENFQKIADIAKEKIETAINKINDANFNIEPKILGDKNISCEFCKFKAICFVNEKDYINITVDNNLSYLEGDNND
jgi:ATP-dependent helicase/DNAse subunit B